LLEKRYSQAAKVLGTITIIIAYMVIAGYQFKGGGRFIAILSEGAITPDEGMLIACVLIVGFTVLAGMVSIVSIDIFNGTVMLLAMIVTLPFAISTHGGIDAVIATIDATAPSHLSLFGGHDFFWVVGIALPTFLLLMSESSMYQKFSSADNAANAKKAVLGMFVGVVIVELLMMLIALVGFAIYADDPRFFLADGSINRAMAEEIILRIGFEQLPTIIGSLLLAAGAAIIISTGNTFLMVTSTNVTRDIFQAFFFKNANPKQIVVIQRVTIIGIGVLAFLMMSQFETILEMALISYTLFLEASEPRRGRGVYRIRHADGSRHHRNELDIQEQRGWRAGTGCFIPNGHGLHRDSGSHRFGADLSACQPGNGKAARKRLAGVYRSVMLD